MNVYFIPGLGADKRVFKHVRLPAGFNIVHLEWETPLVGESLVGYAKRMSAKIDNSMPFVLVGLSFGGMLATEISKLLPPEVLILISTITGPEQLPYWVRIARPMNLHKYVPIGVFQQASLAKRIFSTESKEDKALLRTIIKDSDKDFLRWAMGAILNWKPAAELNSEIRKMHLHGDSDRLLPYKFTEPTHLIKGAGHLMIMNRANEINHLLCEILLKRIDKEFN
jgi:pimeloyl-ACP methyl ester carboxylesterase